MNVPGFSSVGVGVGVAAVAAVLLFIISRNAAAVGAAAGKAVGDAAGGVVLGIGDSLGVPRTNASDCDAAISQGRTWDASFACPATRWVKSIFGGGNVEATPAGADVNAAAAAPSSAYTNPAGAMDTYYGNPFGGGIVGGA